MGNTFTITLRFIATADTPVSRAGGYWIAEDTEGRRLEGATREEAILRLKRARRCARQINRLPSRIGDSTR